MNHDVYSNILQRKNPLLQPSRTELLFGEEAEVFQNEESLSIVTLFMLNRTPVKLKASSCTGCSVHLVSLCSAGSEGIHFRKAECCRVQIYAAHSSILSFRMMYSFTLILST